MLRCDNAKQWQRKWSADSCTLQHLLQLGSSLRPILVRLYLKLVCPVSTPTISLRHLNLLAFFIVLVSVLEPDRSFVIKWHEISCKNKFSFTSKENVLHCEKLISKILCLCKILRDSYDIEFKIRSVIKF